MERPRSHKPPLVVAREAHRGYASIMRSAVSEGKSPLASKKLAVSASDGDPHRQLMRETALRRKRQIALERRLQEEEEQRIQSALQAKHTEQLMHLQELGMGNGDRRPRASAVLGAPGGRALSARRTVDKLQPVGQAAVPEQGPDFMTFLQDVRQKLGENGSGHPAMRTAAHRPTDTPVGQADQNMESVAPYLSSIRDKTLLMNTFTEAERAVHSSEPLRKNTSLALPHSTYDKRTASSLAACSHAPQDPSGTVELSFLKAKKIEASAARLPAIRSAGQGHGTPTMLKPIDDVSEDEYAGDSTMQSLTLSRTDNDAVMHLPSNVASSRAAAQSSSDSDDSGAVAAAASIHDSRLSSASRRGMTFEQIQRQRQDSARMQPQNAPAAADSAGTSKHNRTAGKAPPRTRQDLLLSMKLREITREEQGLQRELQNIDIQLHNMRGDKGDTDSVASVSLLNCPTTEYDRYRTGRQRLDEEPTPEELQRREEDAKRLAILHDKSLARNSLHNAATGAKKLVVVNSQHILGEQRANEDAETSACAAHSMGQRRNKSVSFSLDASQIEQENCSTNRTPSEPKAKGPSYSELSRRNAAAGTPHREGGARKLLRRSSARLSTTSDRDRQMASAESLPKRVSFVEGNDSGIAVVDPTLLANVFGASSEISTKRLSSNMVQGSKPHGSAPEARAGARRFANGQVTEGGSSEPWGSIDKLVHAGYKEGPAIADDRDAASPTDVRNPGAPEQVLLQSDARAEHDTHSSRSVVRLPAYASRSYSSKGVSIVEYIESSSDDSDTTERLRENTGGRKAGSHGAAVARVPYVQREGHPATDPAGELLLSDVLSEDYDFDDYAVEPDAQPSATSD